MCSATVLYVADRNARRSSGMRWWKRNQACVGGKGKKPSGTCRRRVTEMQINFCHSVPKNMPATKAVKSTPPEKQTPTECWRGSAARTLPRPSLPAVQTPRWQLRSSVPTGVATYTFDSTQNLQFSGWHEPYAVWGTCPTGTPQAPGCGGRRDWEVVVAPRCPCDVWKEEGKDKMCNARFVKCN